MLKKKSGYVVAVVGATGAVGTEMIAVLEERKFPVIRLVPLASARSAGGTVTFQGTEVAIEVLTKDSFVGVDIALFSAGADLSREFAPIAVKAGAVVIDNSAAWRMTPEVPLVVPEVNAHDLQWHKGIIANPNCSTIQMVVALKPLHDEVRIKRIVVTTFQSVSGTGKDAMDELMTECQDLLSFKSASPKVYPYQIAFNLLPHIGSFNDGGACSEEVKIVQETRKILETPALRVTATTVRVPVLRCHSEAINVELDRPLKPNEARAVLAGMPGVLVYDDPSKKLYPMPLDATGKDEVYIGRVREDESIANGLNLWVVSDNLRKGAALNAVQIAECLVKG